MESDSFKLFETIVIPALCVWATEVIVDWLKHAFITKFNFIKPEAYSIFLNSLSRELVVSKTSLDDSVDRSSSVSRRIGFVSIPLVCLVIRVLLQASDSVDWNFTLFATLNRIYRAVSQG